MDKANYNLITDYLITKLKVNTSCVDMETGEVLDPVLTDAQKKECEEFCTGAEGAAILLRDKRDRLLQQSDWTQGSDVPDAIKTPWAAYRKELRDLPANTSDPANPTWPTKPN
tara:strand:+ start:394 stop:732 length:339 start_codon:yes stop_codon:yes gene_type:complete